MKVSLSKSWNLGPFKATVSKTAVSLSIGIPGARVGINTNGQVFYRIGSGGLSYQKRQSIN